MFKLFNKKNNNKITYKIAFCDTPDINTKFSEDNHIFTSKEDAWHMICSFTNGWGQAIANEGTQFTNNAAKISGAWLVIEENKA